MTIERTDLSIDAIKINNEYFEDLNIGYRTTKAVGRELVDRELSTTDTLRDGVILKSTKYNARIIKVSFIVQRSTMALMRSAMEVLKQKLNVENVEVRFNGDSDYYYIGTPTLEDDLTETWNGLAGVISIACHDPCKYSNEKTVDAVGGVFTLTYNGTYKSYPKLIATFPATLNGNGVNTDTSECGYIGYANQRENVLQFGDPEEQDLGDITYPATVAWDQPAFKATSGWSANSSTVLAGTETGSVTANNTNGYIYPSSYNTGTGWHGPSLKKLITGETPPIGTDFNFYWKQKFNASSDKQYGGAEIILWNNNSGTYTMVGAVQILKTDKGKKCTINLFCGSTTKGASLTKIATSKIGSCSMIKVGSQITFKIAGKSKSLKNSAIETLLANEITFHFMQKKTQTVLNANYIYSCQLQRMPFEAEGNIANTFMPGQVLTVDTQNAAVYLDDGSGTVENATIGALGNDWEDFYLVPGTNTIACDYSDFTTTAPTFQLKYRERFL